MKKYYDSTLVYYENNAHEFYNSTLNVDLSAILRRFVAYLPEGGKVLDAGCGSGRDSLWMIDKGFEVVSFDCSKNLAQMASKLIGKKVHVQSFLDIEYKSEFDGVWACASLLHVKQDKLKEAIIRLNHSLKLCGYLYVSFKYGDGELLSNDGRYFVNMDEQSLAKIIKDVKDFALVENWITEDARPNRKKEFWLNAILIKK